LPRVEIYEANYYAIFCNLETNTQHKQERLMLLSSKLISTEQ